VSEGTTPLILSHQRRAVLIHVRGIALEDIDRIFGDHMAHQDMEEKLKIVDIISGDPQPAEVLEVPEKGLASRKGSETGLEAGSGVGSSGSSTWAK
jgi:hypothetical protein